MISHEILQIRFFVFRRRSVALLRFGLLCMHHMKQQQHTDNKRALPLCASDDRYARLVNIHVVAEYERRVMLVNTHTPYDTRTLFVLRMIYSRTSTQCNIPDTIVIFVIHIIYHIHIYKYSTYTINMWCCKKEARLFARFNGTNAQTHSRKPFVCEVLEQQYCCTASSRCELWATDVSCKSQYSSTAI